MSKKNKNGFLGYDELMVGERREIRIPKDLNPPRVCMDDDCMRKGIQVFGRRECAECGSELVPMVREQDYNESQLEMWSARYDSVQLIAPPSPPKNDTFTCPPDLIGCPIASKSKVFVPITLYNKWVFLAEQVTTEWIAYLKGKEIKKDEYEITEMYFPKQKAHSKTCEAAEGEIQEGTIASVHSHVDMEVFFSAEDQKHFNHQIEMVVNSKGAIKANGRTMLECGRFHRGPAEIIFVGCDEELGMLKELQSKIVKDTTQFTTKGAL